MVPLPTSVAVDLGHAMLARALVQTGGRGLFFKGPTAEKHNVRPPKSSTDVDVLVEPGGLADLLALLEQHGWVRRPTGDALNVAPTHATTLIHPGWPIDLDIHHRVPGCEISADEAFAILWAERETVDLAHHRLPVPARVDHALLVALNALRSPWLDGTQPLVSHLLTALSPSDVDSLALRAQVLKAAGSLAPLLARLRDNYEGDYPPPSREWLLYQHMEHPAVTWLAAMEGVPWTRRPRLIAGALVPSRSLMAKRDLRMADAARSTLARERLARIAGFASQALPALRAYLHFRRALQRSGVDPRI